MNLVTVLDSEKFPIFTVPLLPLDQLLIEAIEIEKFNQAQIDGIRFPDDIPGELRAFEL